MMQTDTFKDKVVIVTGGAAWATPWTLPIWCYSSVATRQA